MHELVVEFLGGVRPRTQLVPAPIGPNNVPSALKASDPEGYADWIAVDPSVDALPSWSSTGAALASRRSVWSRRNCDRELIRRSLASICQSLWSAPGIRTNCLGSEAAW